MSNVPLMFQPLVKYAEFNGRSRRSEFWLWVLFKMILGSVLATGIMAFIMPVAMQIESNPQAFMSRYFTVMPLMSLIQLGLLLPSLAVGVRRLHDINRTGWWLIMPHVVAVIGVVIFFVVMGTSLFSLVGAADRSMSEQETVKFVLGLFGSMFLFIWLPVLISQIVMLVFFVTDGTAGPNRFGLDPKGRGTAPMTEPVVGPAE